MGNVKVSSFVVRRSRRCGRFTDVRDKLFSRLVFWEVGGGAHFPMMGDVDWLPGAKGKVREVSDIYV